MVGVNSTRLEVVGIRWYGCETSYQFNLMSSSLSSKGQKTKLKNTIRFNGSNIVGSSPRANRSPAPYTSASMTSISGPTEFELSELLLCARYGDESDLHDIKAFVGKYGQSWLADARDSRGNTMLHMAGGNGHAGQFLSVPIGQRNKNSF